MREPGVQSAALHHQAVSHQNILVGDYLCNFSDSRSHLLLQSFLLLSRCDDDVTKPEIHTAERTFFFCKYIKKIRFLEFVLI